MADFLRVSQSKSTRKIPVSHRAPLSKPPPPPPPPPSHEKQCSPRPKNNPGRQKIIPPDQKQHRASRIISRSQKLHWVSKNDSPVQKNNPGYPKMIPPVQKTTLGIKNHPSPTKKTTLGIKKTFPSPQNDTGHPKTSPSVPTRTLGIQMTSTRLTQDHPSHIDLDSSRMMYCLCITKSSPKVQFWGA